MTRQISRISTFFIGIYLLLQSTGLAAQGMPCPDITMEFAVPAVICYDSNTNFIDLDVTIFGDNGTGSGLWSGPNISNQEEGFFRTAFAQAGDYTVYYTYTEEMCTYRDSTTFFFSRLSSPFFLASSERSNHLCQDSFSILRVLSQYDPATVNLLWDLDGGTAVEQGGPDSLHVSWENPDTLTLSLQYEQFGCLSPAFLQQLILDPLIDTPEVRCLQTLNRVVYEWEDPPNSNATIVFVITGPNGVADTTEDRYTIDNLMPGQTVQVRMTTTSENTCDGNFIEPVCEALPCDEDLLEIHPISFACIRGSGTDTVDLSYTLLDTVTQHTLRWSGDGIFDPDQARIVLDSSMFGQTQWVYLTFTSATCNVTDSISFELATPPEPDFSLPATACVGDIVLAQTQAPEPDTTLLWSFGDAAVGGDPAGGAAELSWNETGTQTVGLALQVGSCVSDTVYRFVNIQAAPDTAIIDCQAGATEILFSWDEVSGATGYEVRVISGPAGVRVSETSYRVSDLNEGQEVTIEVTTLGAGVCPRRSVTKSCAALGCPPIVVSVDTIPPICLSADTLIDLTATLSGDNGMGLLSWSGPRVSGQQWNPDVSLSGQEVLLYAMYEEQGCRYQDSISVSIGHFPEATLQLPAGACINEEVQVLAEGAPAGADYTWRIDGNIDAGLTGAGPHPLSWAVDGDHRISLTLTSEHCTATLPERIIRVEGPLADPQIECTPDVDNILFTWQDVPGATAYEVRVITGPNGTRIDETSYQISGLAEGQEAGIEVTVIGSDNCTPTVATKTCLPSGCPSSTVSIDPIDPICLSGDTVISLQATLTGDDGSGSLIWDGPQVSGASWRPDSGMSGSPVTIRVAYQQDICIYRDSIQVAVASMPVADFTLPAVACAGENISLQAQPTGTSAAQYNWLIDGQAGTDLSGAGPHAISWPDPGQHRVSLEVQEAHCMAPPLERMIQIAAPLDTPRIVCTTDIDRVLFEWNTVPEAIGFSINVLQGPSGTFTSDTSLLVDALQPGESVTIEVIMESDGTCPSSRAVQTCAADECPEVSIAIDAAGVPSVVCIGDVPMSFDIDIQTNGDMTAGDLFLTGPGVSDSTVFTWVADPSMAGGVYTLTAGYRNRVCVYEDEIEIRVISRPEADFALPAAGCVDETIELVFTGQAGPQAVYHWEPITAQTAGPHMFTPADTGPLNVSLSVEEQGCRSDTVSQLMDVFAPYTAPQISCNPGLDQIEFSWPSQVVSKQEVIYNGPGVIQITSDTSRLITDLPVDTEVTFQVVYTDSLACRNAEATAICRTQSCDDLSLSWSAPAEVCEQTAVPITFTTIGAGHQGFDVVVDHNGQRIAHSGIKDQSTLVFELTQDATFEIIQAELPGAEICSVVLPPALQVAVQSPPEAGQAMDLVDRCAGLDTIISLSQQLAQADGGGLWSIVPGSPDPGTALQSATGSLRLRDLLAGTYRFQYRVQGGGVCPADSVQLSLNILPTPLANAGQDTRLDCQFNVATIGVGTPTAGFQYEWTGGASNAITEPSEAVTEVSQAGLYTLSVRDPATGCSAEDQVEVLPSAGMVEPYITVSSLSCFAADDGFIEIDSLVGGLEPYRIFLNGEDRGARTFFGNLTPGNYDLVIRSADGCEASVAIRIEAPSELAVELMGNLESDHAVIQLGDSIQLVVQVNIPESQVTDIQWTPADPTDNRNSFTRLVRPVVTSTYQVRVTDSNGCTGSDQLTVLVRKDLNIFVPNAFSPNNDGHNDRFFIQTGNNIRLIRRLGIFNRWGEQLFARQEIPPNDPDSGWDGTTRGNLQPPGVYIYYAEIELANGEVVIVEGDVALVR